MDPKIEPLNMKLPSADGKDFDLDKLELSQLSRDIKEGGGQEEGSQIELADQTYASGPNKSTKIVPSKPLTKEPNSLNDS